MTAQATGQIPLTMGQGLSTVRDDHPGERPRRRPGGGGRQRARRRPHRRLPRHALDSRPGVRSVQGELPFRCVDANTAQELTSDRYVVSVKRIYVRRTDKNQNPAVPAVTWDGQPWAEGDVKEVAPCKNDPLVAIDDCDGRREARALGGHPPRDRRVGHERARRLPSPRTSWSSITARTGSSSGTGARARPRRPSGRRGPRPPGRNKRSGSWYARTAAA